MERIKACSLHSGGKKSQALFFDWRGQGFVPSRNQARESRNIESNFSTGQEGECRKKVQTAFQEMQQENSRLEDVLKFYTRAVASTFDNESAAAKTLGIKVPELESILRT